MAEVTFAFEIVSDEHVTLDTEDYEADMDKPWDEMTAEEKRDFAMEYMYDDALRDAEQSEHSIGALDFVEIDGEEMR